MKTKVTYFADTTRPLVVYTLLEPGETMTDFSRAGKLIVGDPDYGTYIVTTFFSDGGITQDERLARKIEINEADLTFDVHI